MVDFEAVLMVENWKGIIGFHMVTIKSYSYRYESAYIVHISTI